MYPQPQSGDDQPTLPRAAVKPCKYPGCHQYLWRAAKEAYCTEHRPVAMLRARVVAGKRGDWYGGANHITKMTDPRGRDIPPYPYRGALL
jgi:hypothetical protein